MNRHAVLLREPQWANIAARENYKIRPDLKPLFDAHPDSLELLDAMAAEGLHREGCEFIARMTHRRAAVWWGYCCLLDLFEERKAVESGAAKREPDEIELMVKEAAEQFGIKMPPKPKGLEDIDNFCKMPDVDCEKMLVNYQPPPQDRSAIDAAAAAVRAKTAQLESLVPPPIRDLYAASHRKGEAMAAATLGQTPADALDEAIKNLAFGPVTCKLDRLNSPNVQKVLRIMDILETKRQGIIAQMKAAFSEKYPATPEAKLLLEADVKARSDNAVQAVWRWIVSPDERNTALAMEAGNDSAGTPEGLLAFTAAWSFGDLAPEGKTTVPVPPELPGTGLNSALLMMALDQGGHLKMPERYERYFNMGMDVVFGKNLWPDAVGEELSPHAELEKVGGQWFGKRFREGGVT